MRTAPGVRALASLAALVAVLVAAAAPALASDPEWNIARVGAPASAAGVLVAVVDTGVDASHPALAGRVERAIDLVGGSGGDPNGHGTHVAGTVAGADAGCGNIGVAPDARILPVRVLDGNGEGTADVVADGIRRAADAGAAVINLSLGTDVVLRNLSGSGLKEAIDYAWSKGSIPVLAAGNDGLVGGIFGSGYGGIPAVVVTATDNADRVAPYATSIGSADWGIAAPGGDGSGEQGRDILSAFPGRRCALNAGTSMAAPHVSGALAALRAKGHPPPAAIERLLATARDLGRPGPDATYGHGLLDVRAAVVTSAPPPPRVTQPPAPAPSPPTTAAAGAPAPTARTAEPSPSGTPATTGGRAPSGEPSGAAATDDSDPTPTTPPSRPQPPSSPPAGDGDRVDESAASTITDADDDGPPAAVVVLAVASLAVAGGASALAARRLSRS